MGVNKTETLTDVSSDKFGTPPSNNVSEGPASRLMVMGWGEEALSTIVTSSSYIKDSWSSII